MTTITIPEKTTSHNDLVAVPRDTYKEFLHWSRNVKSRNTFKPTAGEKIALIRARKNKTRGDYLTIDELKHALGTARRQKRS